MKHVVRGGLLLLGMCFGSAQAQSLTQVTGFGTNPGALTMYKYVPSGLPANAPLVVALHGCAQSASNYDAETGWILLADRWKFALLPPDNATGNYVKVIQRVPVRIHFEDTTRAYQLLKPGFSVIVTK